MKEDAGAQSVGSDDFGLARMDWGSAGEFLVLFFEAEAVLEILAETNCDSVMPKLIFCAANHSKSAASRFMIPFSVL